MEVNRTLVIHDETVVDNDVKVVSIVSHTLLPNWGSEEPKCRLDWRDWHDMAVCDSWDISNLRCQMGLL